MFELAKTNNPAPYKSACGKRLLWLRGVPLATVEPYVIIMCPSSVDVSTM